MGTVMTFRENIRAKRESDYGLENALAKHVRNRWPDKAVQYVAHEWDLSESEAAKVVYANASKNTLNKILHHKRGGAFLFIQLVCDVAATPLERIVEMQAERARHESAQWDAEERRLAAMSARLSERRPADRRGAV
jgi:hypothetical protein